jgi:ferredoxin, 2Fe-2S
MGIEGAPHCIHASSGCLITPMAKITYIEAGGARHVVNVEPGMSVMRGAVAHGIPGILAECGGNCACGTCRIYVEDEWRPIVGDASEIEEETLDVGVDPLPGKRLACQITVTEELDGMVVRMPASQFE